MKYTYPKEIAIEYSKRIDKGLLQNIKEDKLSFKKLCDKIQKETMKSVHDSMRYHSPQLWKSIYTYETGGRYYFKEICTSEQSQEIPLSEWWTRQLA